MTKIYKNKTMKSRYYNNKTKKLHSRGGANVSPEEGVSQSDIELENNLVLPNIPLPNVLTLPDIALPSGSLDREKDEDAKAADKEEAALKLQALRRGKLGRAEAKKIRDAAEDAGVMEMENVNDLALKLQALSRGKLGRAEAKKVREGAKEAKVVEEEEEVKLEKRLA